MTKDKVTAFYPAISTFAVQICYTNKFLLYSCVYPAMSKKSENLSDLDKKDRNKRHSSPFINVVKGVFFVVRVTLVPVSYMSAPSADLSLLKYKMAPDIDNEIKSVILKLN
jgi:hypothetical protein